MGAPTSKAIALDEFNSFLSRYPATIASHTFSTVATASKPTKAAPPAAGTLSELDSWRLETLPEMVSARKPPHLTKAEVESILHCKMQRGKRRAALPALLASNRDDAIVTATTAAFAQLANGPGVPSTDLIMSALADLCAPIKGVGPATASYMLAVVSAKDVPVFSDEGFRWMVYEEGEGKGWDRKIKYDAKEYRRYVDEVKALRKRLGADITAGDVEKVAFVIGKEVVGAGVVEAGAKKTTAADKKEVLAEAGTNLSKKRKSPGDGETLGASSSKVDKQGAKRGGGWKRVEDNPPPAPRKPGSRAAKPQKGRKKAWVFTGLKG